MAGQPLLGGRVEMWWSQLDTELTSELSCSAGVSRHVIGA